MEEKLKKESDSNKYNIISIILFIIFSFFTLIVFLNFSKEINKTQYDELLTFKEKCNMNYSCRKYFKESLEDNYISINEYINLRLIIEDMSDKRYKQTDYKNVNFNLINELKN